MSLPDLCAQHPLAAMLGGALAFMAVRAVLTCEDIPEGEITSNSVPAGWDAVSMATWKTLMESMPPGRRRRVVEDLRASSAYRTDEWFWKSMDELEKRAAEADAVASGEDWDEDAPIPPDDGDDFPSGAAGADGPDACSLFPSADTRSWSPTSASTSAPP